MNENAVILLEKAKINALSNRNAALINMMYSKAAKEAKKIKVI
jgi:hypothetical protein